jgi:tRNA(Ile)-lysidine synthase
MSATVQHTPAPAVPEGLEQAVAEEVTRKRLLRGIRCLGLAVSGGADSVALFHLLRPLCEAAGIRTVVFHLNHGLRGEAADGDACFVRSLAHAAGIACITGRADLAGRTPDGQSPERVARDARLAFFRQAAEETGAEAIATGHQADDVAETLLLRLARGAGATGLAGLRPRTSLPRSTRILIRPLLSFPGAVLRAWLRDRGLDWREDHSNLDRTIPRNRIRHALIPDLERFLQPGLRTRLCRSAAILREEDALLETLAGRALDALAPLQPEGLPDSLPAVALLEHPLALQRRILRLWLFRQACPEAAGFAGVDALLDMCRDGKGRSVCLPGGKTFRLHDGLLQLQPAREIPPPETSLSCPGVCRWGALEIVAEFSCGITGTVTGINRYPAVCTLCADTLAGRALLVRSRRPGDRIAPVGLNGTKKIQDLFTDEKIPEAVRDAIPLFECDGELAWVPGYRIGRRFAVPAADAASVRVTVRRAETDAVRGAPPRPDESDQPR